MKTATFAFIAFVALFIGTPQAANAADEPHNEIVIIVDASGSYRARQVEAINKAGILLRGIAERRRRRWEAADRITVVSLDASPEIIWSGPANGLSAEARAVWEARFRGRSDYAACTDVAAALRVAASQLNMAPPSSERWLFIFSDLKHEPPTTGVSGCRAPVSVPADGVPWSDLRNVQISAFWMPVVQKASWREAFAAHGVEHARLFSESESAVNDISVPDRVVRESTPEEKAANRENLSSWFSWAIGWLVRIALALGVGAVILVAVALRRRSRRQPAPASRPAERPASAQSASRP